MNNFSITDFLTKQSRIENVNKFFLENQYQIEFQSETESKNKSNSRGSYPNIEKNTVYFDHNDHIFKIFFDFLKIQNQNYKGHNQDDYQLILLTFPEIDNNQISLESSFFFFLPKNIPSCQTSKIYSELGYFFTFKDQGCYITYFPFGNLSFIAKYWFDPSDSNFNNLVFSETTRDVRDPDGFYHMLSQEVNLKTNYLSSNYHNYLPIKWLSKNKLLEYISRIEIIKKIENEIEKSNSRGKMNLEKMNLENLKFWKELIQIPLELKYLIFNYLGTWSRLIALD